MELKDLIGEKMLSGLDTDIIESTDPWYENANAIYFILDGVTYKAVEDPSDGYRSYLGSIEVVEKEIKNTFPPQKVIGTMKPDDTYSLNDTIQFVDVVTGKIVLEIGTDNHDDYYPMCVLEWHPENMAINIGR